MLGWSRGIQDWSLRMANERHRFQNLHQSNQAVRGEQAKQSDTRKIIGVTRALVLPVALSMLVLLAGCGVEDAGGLLSEPQPSATAAAGTPAAAGTVVPGEAPASQEGQLAAPTEAPAAPTEAPAAGGQGGGAVTT